MARNAATPTLDRLLADGVVWQEGRDYVGRAGDGVIVSVGSVDSPASTEDYLYTHPSPCDW
jgi:hypothetical protein